MSKALLNKVPTPTPLFPHSGAESVTIPAVNISLPGASACARLTTGSPSRTPANNDVPAWRTARVMLALLVGLSVCVAANASAAPTPVIEAAPLVVEGEQPVRFSAARSTGNPAIVSYLWRFPARDIRFHGYALNCFEWIWRGNVAQQDQLRLTGNQNWGQNYIFSKWSVARGGTFEGTVQTSTGAESRVMIGLLDPASSDGNFRNMAYALYLRCGFFDIYEYGYRQQLAAGVYTLGQVIDFRIETLPGSGARFYWRPSNSGQPHVLLYQSSADNLPALNVGFDVHTDTFAFDDLHVTGVCSDKTDLTVPVSSSGPVSLTVTDAGGLSATTNVAVQCFTRAPPCAALTGLTNGSQSVAFAFDASASGDDHGIAGYRWDFGDGCTALGAAFMPHYYGAAGVYTVSVEVADFAGQKDATSRVVQVIVQPAVRTVPWRLISGREFPHETWSGRETLLKAVAGRVTLPFTYEWDFGDGAAPLVQTASTAAQAHALEARHIYNAPAGAQFTAIVTVRDSSGASAIAAYPLLIQPLSLDVETRAACDDGLWFLHKSLQRLALPDGTPAGKWMYATYASYSPTAAGLHALALFGHTETGDFQRDPYAEDAFLGMNHLLSGLRAVAIGPQPAGNPDSNHNGIGLDVDEWMFTYQMGQIMDAIAIGGRPDLTARTGKPEVKGRTYADLMQDMVDTYAWGQRDDGGLNRGGWGYSWQAGSDNSVGQWAAIGMLAAEKLFGSTVPQWVKDQNMNYLLATKLAAGGYAYGLTTREPSTTCAALLQLAWHGIPTTDPLWRHGEDFLAAEWAARMKSYELYTYFTVAKALRLAVPHPVERLGFSGKDWYRDPTNGLARVLLAKRNPADGSWPPDNIYIDSVIGTAFAVISLSGAVLQQSPVAEMTMTPNPCRVGQEALFDARASYHPDPNRRIARCLWDFDSVDGVDFQAPDAEGPVVTHRYAAPGAYTVSLRVEDDYPAPLHSETNALVRVEISTYPPVAEAGGPYVAAVGEPLQLDGSGSFDLDAGAGDRIQRWDWEIDGVEPHDFDDRLHGRRASLAGGFPTAGRKTLGLRVTDVTSTLYPGAGVADQTGSDLAAVIIYDRRVEDLRARTKLNKCQLTWTAQGDEAVIYRSEQGPNAGFVEIGRTASDYATFLDQPIAQDRDYYYRVFVYESGNTNPLGISPAVHAVAVPLADNKAPEFVSRPILAARVGMPWEYQAQAVDLEVDPLTFALLSGPACMTLDPTNGMLRFTAVAGQIGEHEVTLEVRDAARKDVQNFTLIVFPGANSNPIARVNGPYAGAPGVAVSFTSAGSVDPDNDTLGFLWNFGDGAVADEPAPTHVYAAGGSYIVTLIVRDNNSATATASTRCDIVRPNQLPRPALAGGPQFSVRCGEQIVLDGSSSSDPDGDRVYLAWNWGDGAVTANAGRFASHVYTNQGAFSGALMAEDRRGGSASAAFEVLVGPSNAAPRAAFAVTETGTNVGDRFAFDASATTDPESDPMLYTWDLGDGARQGGITAEHEYREAGEFTVTLVVRDNHNGLAVTSRTVTVTGHKPVILSMPPLAAGVGVDYVYPVQARDNAGGSLTYALVTMPAGMTLDPQTGRIGWVPSAAQVGIHNVLLRVGNAQGLFAEQSYCVEVRANAHPPVVSIVAPAVARVGVPVRVDAGNALDPDGDSLTFAWTAQAVPCGSLALPASVNLAAFSFVPDLSGMYRLSLRVSDGFFSVMAQVAIAVAPADANLPPDITSEPSGPAMVSVPYIYPVNAVDPDHDPLTFTLPLAPAGMSVDSAGIVTWTPNQAGTVSVQVRVEDSRGGQVSQTWQLPVDPYRNLPPEITSTAPPAVAEIDRLYAFDVEASDFNQQPLTFRLVAAPAAMTLDARSGLVQWTPSQSDLGAHTIEVQVADSQGETAQLRWSLVVVRDAATSPAVSVIPAQSVFDPQPFSVIRLDDYVADPDHADADLAWSVTGNSALAVDISPARMASITYAPGVRASEDIAFTATDPQGNSGRVTARFTVRGPDQPPIAELAGLSPDETTHIREGLYELRGVADDPDAVDPVSYRISLFRPDGGFVKDLTPEPRNANGYHEARVPAPVPPATGYSTLATLDFTLLRNGVYDLYLDVRAGAGAGAASARIALNSRLKVGRFSLSERDASISIHGVPLSVTRTYDSLNTQSSAFGAGWTFTMSEMEIEFDELRVEDFQLLSNEPYSLRIGGSRDVTLPLPDTGRRVTFRVKFERADDYGLVWRAVWTPPPGVYATLEPTCSPNLISLPGAWGPPLQYWEAGGLLNSEWFDFPGFILTAKDGTQYHIEREPQGQLMLTEVLGYKGGHLARITDAAGNRIEFVRSQGALQEVAHCNALGEKTGGFAFLRDPQDRIVSVYDPDDLDAAGLPEGPALVKYEYDALGNLVAVQRLADNGNPANPVYAATTYTYGNPDFPHYITGIRDARGVERIRTEYDDNGRIAAVIDANGQPVRFEHDLAAQTETVFDQAGSPTIHAYDRRGNVVATIDALGNTTQWAYDEAGNEIAATDPLGQVTRYTYDAAGNQLSVVDPLGHTNRCTYGAKGRVLTATDALARTTRFTYDPATGALKGIENAAGERLALDRDRRGLPTALLDPYGHWTLFEYNAQGNVKKITDPAGNSKSYVLDDDQRCVCVSNSLGHLTRGQYDRRGNLVALVDALGRVKRFEYDLNGNLTARSVERTTAAGRETLTTRWIRDAQGRELLRIDPDGTSESTSYTVTGQQSAHIDKAGRQTRYEYDKAGRLTRTVHPDGAVAEKAYDAAGRCVREIAPGGLVTDYDYDAAGRLIATRFPDGTQSNTFYDAAGRVIAVSDKEGRTTSYAYDAVGRLVALTDVAGGVTRYVYDQGGNPVRVIDALGHTNEFVYDACGRAIRAVFPDGAAEQAFRDEAGRVIVFTDKARRAIRYQYDPLGCLTAVENSAGGQTAYAYDELGNRTAVVDARGRRTEFEYDALGRQTSRKLPLGMTEMQSFDTAGNLVARWSFGNDTTTFEYDAMNRLIARHPDPARGEATVRYTYAPNGQRATVTDSLGTTRYEYDAGGRLTRKETPVGSLVYTYDAAGNVASVRSSNPHGAACDYQWDALRRLLSVTDADGQVTSNRYDAIGNRVECVYPNGMRVLYGYDPLRRLTNVVALAGNEEIARYGYSLDAVGNRVAVQEGTGRSVAYQYDAIDRLIGESVTRDPAGNNGQVAYEFDSVGNRLGRSSTLAGVQAGVYAYDANDRRLDGYQHDANGNVIGWRLASGLSVTDAYDSENRLVSRDGGAITLAYDADGNRVVKSASGETRVFLVDELSPCGYPQVIEEIAMYGGGTSEVRRIYAHGMGPISQKLLAGPGIGKTYFGRDGQGSVRFLADAAGAVTDTCTYDAYGLLLGQTGQTPNDYRYAGEQYDADLELYYLRARNLNPDTGRFHSIDPFEGLPAKPATLHKYAYAENNPVNKHDPSGRLAVDLASLGNVEGMSVFVGKTVSDLMRGANHNLYRQTVEFDQFWEYSSHLQNVEIGATSLSGAPTQGLLLWYDRFLAEAEQTGRDLADPTSAGEYKLQLDAGLKYDIWQIMASGLLPVGRIGAGGDLEAVIHVDIRQPEVNVHWKQTNAVLNLTLSSYLGGASGSALWVSSPAGLSNIVISADYRTFTFCPSNSIPGEYVVKAWSSLQTNCTDTCTVRVLKVELVPDWNHDRKIDNDDKTAMSTNTFHFWINDDVDSGDVAGLDPHDTYDCPVHWSHIIHPIPNCERATVCGRRDLVDFFPIWLDLHDTLNLMPPSGSVQYKLKQGNSAIQAVYTDLAKDHAGDYLTTEGSVYGPTLDQPSYAASVFTVTSDGVVLSTNFLSKIQNDAAKGVLLMEGVSHNGSPSSAPLILEVWKDGKKIFEKQRPLSLASVTSMFRYLNLRPAAGDATSGGASHTNEPSNNPDSLSNNKHVVFIHGFNESADDGLGNACETFKRLYWSGSRAKYTAVVWRGDQDFPTVTHYHRNVRNAFVTAPQLASYINNLHNTQGQEVNVIAFSLGNMVVSSAIQDYGAQVDRYFLLHAAIALEAYDSSEFAGNMIQKDWVSYTNRLYASNWSKLWDADPTDGRHGLTWRGRFANVIGSQVYNFYSSEDDVLDNCVAQYTPLQTVLDHISHWDFNFRRYAWSCQELYKGKHSDWIGGSTYGGWGFVTYSQSTNYFTNTVVFTPGTPPQITHAIFAPGSAAQIMPAALKTVPFFNSAAPVPSLLIDPTNSLGSGSAYALTNQNRLLAEMIPALSFAAGRNPLSQLQNRNYDMDAMLKTNGFPQARFDDSRPVDKYPWLHGDHRAVAYFYVYPLYEKFSKELGGFNQ